MPQHHFWGLLWRIETDWQTASWFIWWRIFARWITDATSLCQSVVLTSKSVFFMPCLIFRTYEWTTKRGYHGYTTHATQERGVADMLLHLIRQCTSACVPGTRGKLWQIYTGRQKGWTESDHGACPQTRGCSAETQQHSTRWVPCRFQWVLPSNKDTLILKIDSIYFSKNTDRYISGVYLALLSLSENYGFISSLCHHIDFDLIDEKTPSHIWFWEQKTLKPGSLHTYYSYKMKGTKSFRGDIWWFKFCTSWGL